MSCSATTLPSCRVGNQTRSHEWSVRCSTTNGGRRPQLPNVLYAALAQLLWWRGTRRPTTGLSRLETFFRSGALAGTLARRLNRARLLRFVARVMGSLDQPIELLLLCRAHRERCPAARSAGATPSRCPNASHAVEVPAGALAQDHGGGLCGRPARARAQSRRAARDSDSGAPYTYSFRWTRRCSMTLVRISGSWTRGS